MAGKRALRWLGGVLAGALLLGTGWWAARATLAPPVDARPEAESVVVAVVETTVGRSLSLNATVRQPFAAVASNGLAGTVTAVGGHEEVGVGDVLYAVDNMPVRAVVGDTPFWRDLVPGFDGVDVRQLQQALAELGHYHGTVDGRYRDSTTEAVRAWQRELGMPVVGTVRLGELVAVPRLPARLVLGESITLGARVSGGEPAVLAATGEIEFRLVVSESQAALIPPGAAVSVSHQDLTWDAVLGETAVAPDGTLEYTLTGPDGAVVCRDECDRLPAAEHTTLRAEVTVVPEVTGPSVPVAAVRTDPDGAAWVRTADGDRREVTVLGSAGGVAVVDGLRVGERVVLFGEVGDGSRVGGADPPDPSGAPTGGRR